MWGVCWTEWYWNRSSSKCFRFSPVSIVPPLTHRHFVVPEGGLSEDLKTSIRSASPRSGVLKRRCQNCESCVMLRHEDRWRVVDVSGDSAFFRVKQSNHLGQVILACLALRMKPLRSFETSGIVCAAIQRTVTEDLILEKCCGLGNRAASGNNSAFCCKVALTGWLVGRQLQCELQTQLWNV